MKITDDHDFTRILFPRKLTAYWEATDSAEVLAFVSVFFLASVNWGSHTRSYLSIKINQE